MCNHDLKNDSRFIDPCMRKFIENLNHLFLDEMEIVACCCGHRKYPMTIVIKTRDYNYDLVSGKTIPRKKKFYKKDKKGYYYIPETLEDENGRR